MKIKVKLFIGSTIQTRWSIVLQHRWPTKGKLFIQNEEKVEITDNNILFKHHNNSDEKHNAGEKRSVK